MTDLRELLAQNIKTYRKLRGFSQEMLAEKAGTSTTHIGMIEIAKRFPSTEMITRIAGALMVDTPQLFALEQEQLVPMHYVSLQKLYRDILHDFDKVVTERIAHLKEGVS
ncbi:hypothetical protein FACS1894190_08710 [Spirochaetia bacterium]|nr:hypothetical protein FACS1894190_08710 [Spirochaetia bacterium]